MEKRESVDSGRSSSVLEKDLSDQSSQRRKTADGAQKQVKRRAAKACAACRARKVRCDVMQKYHVGPEGAFTCSNCTMDGIKCIIEESKRRKKVLSASNGLPATPNGTQLPFQKDFPQNWGKGNINPADISNLEPRRWSAPDAMPNNPAETSNPHVPHQIYQNLSCQIQQGALPRRTSFLGSPIEGDPASYLINSASIHGDRRKTQLVGTPPPMPQRSHTPLKHELPDFIKPLPSRMTSVDIEYLYAKGALQVPKPKVRNALLESYLEYVHPYMPLVELHEILEIVHDGTGASGRISLLLFQAMMFAGVAFVDIDIIREEGHLTRKAARKAYFQKARVLYDFDYELDRVSLVQSLLLMTYWYETPDDQKDTWHWMGVAISLAHTIGLHRNPENSTMEPRRKKLWKRIWWSCFMRDRLIALGMRRPTRVKEEDYDVPMLRIDDFVIQALPEDNSIISKRHSLARDEDAQRRLALMCIAKAKLCVCISHVLTAQYSVLIRNQGMQDGAGPQPNLMLIPKKIDQRAEVEACDKELKEWLETLPTCCQYGKQYTKHELSQFPSSVPPCIVHNSLLHMIYYTTISALHRPQVLPSTALESARCHDLSRKIVVDASHEITRIAADLSAVGLEKYLPTTGVTVLLPALIIHLLDINSENEDNQRASRDGICQCMRVMSTLRNSYASADYASHFLESAIKKSGVELPIGDAVMEGHEALMSFDPYSAKSREFKEMTKRNALRRTPSIGSVGDLYDSPTSKRDGDNAANLRYRDALTPPSSDNNSTENINPAFGSGNGASQSINCGVDGTSHQQRQQSSNIMALNSGTADEDMEIFLNFENHNTTSSMMNSSMAGLGAGMNLGFGTSDLWNVPIEDIEGHGESGGCVGDLSLWMESSTIWGLPAANSGHMESPAADVMFGVSNVNSGLGVELGGASGGDGVFGGVVNHDHQDTEMGL